MSVRKSMYMYDYIQLCTTYYDTMLNNVRQCSTMHANVRQKILPYDRIFVAPKSFTCKSFFLIRSSAYENLRLTANNRDKSRQHTKNYDFLIRTLSHLKIRMWETSIRLLTKWLEFKLGCSLHNKMTYASLCLASSHTNGELIIFS